MTTAAAQPHAPGPGRRRAARGTDVARLAGVSQKTVSRVLNNEPHVKDEIRRTVLQAARELGYRPNGAARALLSGRTNRIGVVALGSTLHGPASLLMGIERQARALGYGLSIVNTDEGDPDGVPRAVDALLEQGVDGVVVSEPIDLGPVYVTIDVPVLVLGSRRGLTAPTVVEPAGISEQAANDATRHLLDLGHRTVHHVMGPARWLDAQERLNGWRRALAEASAPVTEPVEGDWSPASGFAAGSRLAADPQLRAVFVANDDMAIGLIRALTAAGLHVPDDVSVIGVDDVPLAPYVNPPLTTMAQPFEEIARAGLSALVQAIEDPDGRATHEVRIPARLVLRGSTAAPRAPSPPARPQPVAP